MNASSIVHVIEDDPAVRDSLDLLLAAEGFDGRIHASGRDFLSSVTPGEKACVVTDVRMPEISGLDLISMMKQRGVLMPVIVITAHGDVPLAVEAMKQGAVDFFQKPFEDGAFLAAVRHALASGDEDARLLAERRAQNDDFASLTGRESEVLSRLLQGLSNKAIARELGISVRTVEVHRANVMTKTRAKNLAELVRMALNYQGRKTA
jgi:two-component system, LuxR family, response regulator FixJ